MYMGPPNYLRGGGGVVVAGGGKNSSTWDPRITYVEWWWRAGRGVVGCGGFARDESGAASKDECGEPGVSSKASAAP